MSTFDRHAREARLSSRIRFLQLETGTVCNYRCVYCPVSFAPRRGGYMELDIVRSIADQLLPHAPLAEVYLNGYDEPTLNRRLPEVAEILAPLGGELILLTNATRLTPELANRLAASHARVRIDVHLSADDEEEFRRVHQSGQFRRVRENLEALATRDLAPNISLHVGMQTAENPGALQTHRKVVATYDDSPITVSRYTPNGRAGIMSNEWTDDLHHAGLAGCGLRNRTSEWLHVNANGNVILCCQDYYEEHVLGNVLEQSIESILDGEARSRFHQWTVGADEAPPDYICRRCSHAIPRDV